MQLSTEVTSLPKIGPAFTKALHRLDIFTVQDLLFHFPYRYLDFRKSVLIQDIKENEIVTVKGVIKTIQSRHSFKTRLALTEAIISDETGSIKVVWFNQPYLAKTLHKDDEVLLSGKAGRYKTLQLTNPVYEKFTEESLHTGRLVPVYHSTETIPNRTLRKLVHTCLPALEDLEDQFPAAMLKKLSLLSIRKAVEQLHFPQNYSEVTSGRFRIAFDDILPQQLAVELQAIEQAKQQTYKIEANIDQVKSFLSRLPFELTASQKRATWDILQDISISKPMNRLLQGDVGSGKTLVALLAMMQTSNDDFQSVLLAPTEILARQHYETVQHYLKDYPHQVGLITRNFHTINGENVSKAAYVRALENGQLHISIGTHAQIQEGINFKRLALIVIDEQHRFGVAQRSFLQKKLESKNQTPHLLSMSATPIPRTLALSLYGNLEVSTLSQVPTGRKPIITKIVDDTKRDQAYDFIKLQVKAGRQAFVITPRVEDTEKSEVRSVKREYEKLAKDIFKNFRVGLVYGKMKGTEKDAVMASFYSRELDILVATSVIEIGIDVPNSTVMVIEGAERFGLAQLHQLRGRVGRGEHQSYCFLFTTEPSQSDNDRLKVFSTVLDGFALAALDLEQRGFGNLFGTQQTGFAFRYPEFITVPALETARTGAKLMITKDQKLKHYPHLHKQALRYLEEYHAE